MPDGIFHLRSFVSPAGHELRITARCLNEDLGLETSHDFEQSMRHPIVKALVSERHSSLQGTTTVGPAAGDDTLWVLRRTHRHRGATWFDPDLNVVWLCAYAAHRSGDTEDAFPRFDALRASGEIWPSEEDRFELQNDRAERFTAVVEKEVQDLLAQARDDPGVEHHRQIGTTQPVGILIYLVETLEETYIAVSGATMDLAKLQILLAAIYPDCSFEEWRPEDRLPTRELDVTMAEFCLSIAHEVPEID